MVQEVTFAFSEADLKAKKVGTLLGILHPVVLWL